MSYYTLIFGARGDFFIPSAVKLPFPLPVNLFEGITDMRILLHRLFQGVPPQLVQIAGGGCPHGCGPPFSVKQGHLVEKITCKQAAHIPAYSLLYPW